MKKGLLTDLHVMRFFYPFLCLLASTAFCAAEWEIDSTELSGRGSGRATAYLESPKIITFKGKTHVAWLDSTPEGFRVRAKTLDLGTDEWSPTWTVGEAPDNHGGPALTIDAEGYLHILYYSHHHPLRYRRSVQPNDASAWTPYEEVGVDLTYPALVCAPDGTLFMTARRSYEDKPWELELWAKAPGERWQRRGPVVRSRFEGYAQFAASLSWGPGMEKLYLGTRIYEVSEDGKTPLTTVGYLVGSDSLRTWETSGGEKVALPVTADAIDVIFAGSGHNERVANAGSVGIDATGKPHVPYSVRIQDTSHGYLATPAGGGQWRHLHLNSFLPDPFREWDLFMHGGIAFGSSGKAVLTGTIMQVAADGVDWGDPTTKVVVFLSDGDLQSFQVRIIQPTKDNVPQWMPNIERPTGFNEMQDFPAFITTEGVRGEALEDRLSNTVWFHRIQTACQP